MATTKFLITQIWTKYFQSIKSDFCLSLDLKTNPYFFDYTNYNAVEFLPYSSATGDHKHIASDSV